jgi:hypothetical protein
MMELSDDQTALLRELEEIQANERYPQASTEYGMPFKNGSFADCPR